MRCGGTGDCAIRRLSANPFLFGHTQWVHPPHNAAQVAAVVGRLRERARPLRSMRREQIGGNSGAPGSTLAALVSVSGQLAGNTVSKSDGVGYATFSGQPTVARKRGQRRGDEGLDVARLRRVLCGDKEVHRVGSVGVGALANSTAGAVSTARAAPAASAAATLATTRTACLTVGWGAGASRAAPRATRRRMRRTAWHSWTVARKRA